MQRDMPPHLLTAVLALVTTVISVVSSLGAPLVPLIAEQYDVEVGTAQWTLTATLLLGAVCTPLMGRLGDGPLRGRVLLTGLGVVVAGCVLAALPLGFVALVMGRTLQGVGIGLMPLVIAIARDSLPRDRVGGAVALLSVTTVAGAGLGYPLTAAVASALGVSAAFWCGAVLGASATLLAVFILPPSRENRHTSVDFLGASVLGLGTAGLLLLVSQGQGWGWLSPSTFAIALASVVLLTWWVIRSLRIRNPVVDLRLAFHPGTVGINAVALLVGIGMYLLLTLAVLGAQAPSHSGYGLGRGVFVAGLLLTPYSVTSLLGARLSRGLARWAGPRVALSIGCSLFAAACTMLAFRHDTVTQFVLAMAFGGLGGGSTFGAIPGLLIRRVPASETGAAMAFNQLLRYLGYSVGSALAVTVLEAIGPDGRPSADGFTTAALTGSAICGVGAVLAMAVSSQRT